MELLTIKSYGKTYKVEVIVGKYVHDQTTYMQLMAHDKGRIEPFARVTMNLNHPTLLEEHAYIDTNSNGEEIIDWLKENKLITGVIGKRQSGWVTYPLVEFNMERLREIATLKD